MDDNSVTEAEVRIRELAEDPVCREFIVAYFLGYVEQSRWGWMVQQLLEYKERVENLQKERYGEIATPRKSPR